MKTFDSADAGVDEIQRRIALDQQQDRTVQVAQGYPVDAGKAENAPHFRALSFGRRERKAAARQLGRHFEQRETQSDAARAPCGIKGIDCLPGLFFGHTGAVVPDCDSEGVVLRLFLHGDLDEAGARRDRILRKVQNM